MVGIIRSSQQNQGSSNKIFGSFRSGSSSSQSRSNSDYRLGKQVKKQSFFVKIQNLHTFSFNVGYNAGIRKQSQRNFNRGYNAGARSNSRRNYSQGTSLIGALKLKNLVTYLLSMIENNFKSSFNVKNYRLQCWATISNKI